MKCFYHSDLDGKCAGAIVNFKTAGLFDNREFIKINYRDKFPLESIDKDETVYIVDFSLQNDGDFEKLMEITDNIYWIDHHKSAIEKYGHLNLKGIRDINMSGCELTFKFLYEKSNIPQVIKYIGDYDMWKFEFGEKTKQFQEGMKLYYNEPDSDIWKAVIFEKGIAEKVIEKGKVALQYRDKIYKELVSSWSFEVEFEGHKAIVCNAGNTGSSLFDSIKGDYDLMIPLIFDGKQWSVSIFTKKDIDCSKIAQKYGGGGHKQAAGFQCKELPFNNIKK